MRTIGSVEDYDELRGSDITAGGFDIVLVRQQKASTHPIPLTSPPNGGIFVWDKNAEEVDDGGTIISPSSSPPKRRWKRVFNDTLSVEWFGAKGDMKGTGGHYKGTVLQSSNELNASEPIFREDKGKTIVVWKADKSVSPLISKIKAFISPFEVELIDAPIV